MGLFPAAPFLGRPFSRSYGAILPSSLAMLPPPALGFSPHPPVSVYGTGACRAIAAFLGTRSGCFATLFRSASRLRIPEDGFSGPPPLALAPVFPFPAHPPRMRPRSSACMQYRNFSLLSIGYASLPRLRPRLTRGRSALPRKPWIFGQGDSHPFLATHSGILPSRRSTAPSGTASARRECSPTGAPLAHPRASVACFSPGHFRRGTSRPVSYYALF